MPVDQRDKIDSMQDRIVNFAFSSRAITRSSRKREVVQEIPAAKKNHSGCFTTKHVLKISNYKSLKNIIRY